MSRQTAEERIDNAHGAVEVILDERQKHPRQSPVSTSEAVAVAQVIATLAVAEALLEIGDTLLAGVLFKTMPPRL